jgi:hypothetical protein
MYRPSDAEQHPRHSLALPGMKYETGTPVDDDDSSAVDFDHDLMARKTLGPRLMATTASRPHATKSPQLVTIMLLAISYHQSSFQVVGRCGLTDAKMLSCKALIEYVRRSFQCPPDMKHSSSESHSFSETFM